MSLASLKTYVPEFQRARYDFATRAFRTGEGKSITDGQLKAWSEHPRMRAAGAGGRSIKRGILLNTLARTESGERPGLLERVLQQPRQLVGKQAKRIFYKGSKPAQPQTSSRTDQAVMNMVREGRSSRDMLALIAGTSRKPLYKQVARLLLKTGISPDLAMTGDLGSSNGFKHLAKYNRKQDQISLTEGAQPIAEQIVMHELIHAAKLKSLDGKGLASLQMRKLYEHVKAQGGANGAYCMKNAGEFVAEAFANPEFQRQLRTMQAPPSSVLK